jgi:hypothetical protein
MALAWIDLLTEDAKLCKVMFSHLRGAEQRPPDDCRTPVNTQAASEAFVPARC